MIYYSFLNGTHQAFSTHPLPDDVDALTVWHHSLNGSPMTLGANEAPFSQTPVCGAFFLVKAPSRRCHFFGKTRRAGHPATGTVLTSLSAVVVVLNAQSLRRPWTKH